MGELLRYDEKGMGCVLRVRGDNLDVDDLLMHISVPTCHVQRKGKPRFGPKSRIAEYNGFNVLTSDASERDLPRQVKDTIEFLETHLQDILNIRAYPGVEFLELDFSNESRIGGNIVGQNDLFPQGLISLAGRLGLGINLSTYMPGAQRDDFST
jgi:hypothetical protein